MKKKNKKAFKKIVRFHNNFKSMLDQDRNLRITNQDNNILMQNITSLLEVCVLTLDGKGMFLSPNNQNIDTKDSVARVLEMVMEMLPYSQMEFIENITQQLSEIENNKEL